VSDEEEAGSLLQFGPLDLNRSKLEV